MPSPILILTDRAALARQAVARMWSGRARACGLAHAHRAPAGADPVRQGRLPLRRMSLAILAAVLLLGAGGLTGRASDSRSLVPASDSPTPTPAYRIYIPLASLGAAPEPITLTLAVAPTAWQAESAGLDYAAVVQGTAWLVTYDQGVPAVGQSATAGDRMYRANKAYLYFDTSAIPASATVLSATLTAANCRQVAGVPFTVEFYRTDAPLPPTPADWRNYGGRAGRRVAVGAVRRVGCAAHGHGDAGPGVDRQGRPDALCADDRPPGGRAGARLGHGRQADLRLLRRRRPRGALRDSAAARGLAVNHLRLARVLCLLLTLTVLWGDLPQPVQAAAPRPAPLAQGPGGRRQVFRSDFNTPGNLEGWNIMRQPANTSVQVTNGYLQLSTFGDTNQYPVVERTGIPWPAGDMAIEWRFSSPDAAGRSGFGVNTWVTNGFTKIGSYGIYGSPAGYIWSEYDSAGAIPQGLDTAWHTALIIRRGGVYDFYLDGAYKASWAYANAPTWTAIGDPSDAGLGGAVADHAAGLLCCLRLSADPDAHGDGNGHPDGDCHSNGDADLHRRPPRRRARRPPPLRRRRAKSSATSSWTATATAGGRAARPPACQGFGCMRGRAARPTRCRAAPTAGTSSAACRRAATPSPKTSRSVTSAPARTSWPSACRKAWR